ncbi:alkyldihydroxyacetonephosphate synthase [Streptomyces virginiae]|uniref:Alkyldihydroxyacetonephosphate synthase n=2 Tax=Streptomyces virginiae TaxID=1961 RepID=A0ABQ3NS24_STRVG|nr:MULTISPECIES: FAD-binding oxidoreductase [Streptomyces]KOV17337.1 FAD-linked oxidase [Streptomyces sp. XY511]MBP2348312.1 alkyldihydroxyacetonephosphate synthase [Streptomyces virginiae]GGQ38634.1 alkyldihydroxyacetonephosphate synthase [Streptomyces virginiae]GHI15527.1 alkyldihydroxyacetonephosphate synthase [Streptomyces virginiae]
MPGTTPQPTSATRTRSWWGWGWADAHPDDAECAAMGALIPGTLAHPLPVPRVRDLGVGRPAVEPPASLAHLVATGPEERAAHAMGKAYRDVARALRGRPGRIPDLVARPTDEREVADMLDWAGEREVAVVPYGGGSSVSGGVEYRGDAHRAVLSLDMTAMDRVLEVDAVGRAARIQAGTLGPSLEDQLRPHGLTLRHFPQSFEFSTLGGWLATRAGGHYATGRTHIDDFVQSLRVVTPAGTSASWRLPASGAGPSPDRLFLGSEGALGIITEAWVRLQARPTHKASASLAFTDFHAALAAVRAIAQSDLAPANCRLLDAGEAALSGASHDGSAVLVLGFESADAPVTARLGQAVELARSHGGRRGDVDGAETADTDAAVGAWRSAFLRMPYLRDGLARMGAVAETFETAATWDRIPGLIEAVRTEVGQAALKASGHPATVNCRLTHVYPDGAAPYFTVLAAGRPGDEVAFWDDLKAVASDVLHRHRATITHHHAVGRDHRPGYDRQRPDPFALALRAAKGALDPRGILNPGVLVD